MPAPEEFCFIPCNGLTKKPTGEEFTRLRSHVMRQHLRNNPRSLRASSPSTNSTSPETQGDEPANDALEDAPRPRRRSTRPRPPPHRQTASRQSLDSVDMVSSSQASRDQELRELFSRAEASLNETLDQSQPSSIDIAPEQLVQAEIEGRSVVLRPSTSPFGATTFTPAQFRIQVNALSDHLYYPQAMNQAVFAMDPSTLTSDTLVSLAATAARDALSLILIASVNMDKSLMVQALTRYHEALAHTQIAWAKSSMSQTYAAMIVTIWYLTRYEAVVCERYDNSAGWTQHARAFVNLLRCRPHRDNLPFTKLFRQIVVESFFAAINLGFIIKKWTGIDVAEMQSIFMPHYLILFQALSQVPDTLGDLPTTPSFWHGSSPQHNIARNCVTDALHLWQEVEASSLHLIAVDQTYFTEIEMRDLAGFYAAIGPELCNQFYSALTFKNPHIAVIFRTTWTAQVVLGLHLLTAIPKLPFQEQLTEDIDIPPAGDSQRLDLHTRNLYHVLLARVDSFADRLCRTLPYVAEHMAGAGLASLSRFIYHLSRYYSAHHRNTPLGTLRLAYLKRIRNVLLVGPKIDRLLCGS